MTFHRIALAAAIAAVLATLVAAPASAQDKILLRRGVPQPPAPVNLGVAKGFFAKHGLDIEIIGFFGTPSSSRLSPPARSIWAPARAPVAGFIAKGSPVLAVAEAAGPLLTASPSRC